MAFESEFWRVPDFRVRYRFRKIEDGGRGGPLPKQGYRCDFLYACQRVGSGHDPVYMIWPVFEDQSGSRLPYMTQVLEEGTAQMFNMQENLREFHRERIAVGVRGFMVEGPIIACDLEVIEVLKFQP
jgi:hypothetical protein